LEFRRNELEQSYFLAKQDAFRRGGALVVCLIALIWFCIVASHFEIETILPLVCLGGWALRGQTETARSVRPTGRR